MAFILPYECEFCGHTIKCRKKDLPSTCPECGDIPTRIKDMDCYYCTNYLSQDVTLGCSKLKEHNQDATCPIVSLSNSMPTQKWDDLHFIDRQQYILTYIQLKMPKQTSIYSEMEHEHD